MCSEQCKTECELQSFVMQDSQARQEFVLEQARKQAVQVGQAAIAMPTRVEQMSSTLSSLEGGEIKLL